MYEIQSNIPVPQKPRGKGVSKYPFGKMKKGDSFAVPFGKDARATLRRLSAAATSFKLRHGGQFTIRTMPKEIRVWRIE